MAPLYNPPAAGGGAGAGNWKHDDPISGRARTGLSVPAASWLSPGADGDSYFYPVYYETTFGVDEFGCDIRNGAAGVTARLGLFASAAGAWRPGNVVAQTTASAASGGWKAAGITPVTGLAAGWYWHAFSRQGAAAIIDVWAGPSAVPWFDAPSPNATEYAVREGSERGAALFASGITGAFTNNPVVVADVQRCPRVSVRFA